MPDLVQPTPFGNYLLLDRINRGGMAEVFRAMSFGVAGFQRLVAIKRILPHWATDESFVAMFIDEARLVVQLENPHIVPVLELGSVDGQYYIAMEYVAGRDLRQILDDLKATGATLSIAQATFIATGICAALDHAHRKCGVNGKPLHIVHRDVSPPNVLLGWDGSVKMTDFGIAKAELRSTKTQGGALKGKFSYMSPEQVRGREIDHRADIYAVGILLHEMLTGRRLFTGDSDFEILERVRAGAAPRLRSVNPTLPPELDLIVAKALAPVPETRYAWASDLADDLQPYLIEERSLFTAQKLSAHLAVTYRAPIDAERQRLDALMRQAQALGLTPTPSIEVPPAEAATRIKGRRGTLVFARGSGETRALGPTAAVKSVAATFSLDDPLAATVKDLPVPQIVRPGGGQAPVAAGVPDTVPTPVLPSPAVTPAAQAQPGRTAAAAGVLAVLVVTLAIIAVAAWRGYLALPVGPTPPAASGPPPGGVPAPPAVAGAGGGSPTTAPTPATAATPETPPATSPAAPVAAVEPTPASPDSRTAEEARAELAQVRKALDAHVRRLGLIAGDVPALDSHRTRMAAFTRRNKPEEALEAAERALAVAKSVTVDEAFIGSKLQRLNALADANGDESRREEVARIVTDVGTALAARDLKGANRELNRGFRLLAASP